LRRIRQLSQSIPHGFQLLWWQNRSQHWRHRVCDHTPGGPKNDFRDAEAIAEAVQRPIMKFVATKTADQLDL
jgi:hypothetical protein